MKLTIEDSSNRVFVPDMASYNLTTLNRTGVMKKGRNHRVWTVTMNRKQEKCGEPMGCLDSKTKSKQSEANKPTITRVHGSPNAEYKRNEWMEPSELMVLWRVTSCHFPQLFF